MADSSMDPILARARDLGEALGAHPRFKAYVEASQALQDDAAAREALEAYNEAARGIAEKEQQGQPVEPAKKQAMETKRSAVASNPTVKQFMQAQANYAELMRRVNDAIYGRLAPPEAPPEAAPGQG